MWRCSLLSYRGKSSIDYPAQGKSSRHPPSKRRDLWGRRYRVRTLRWPTTRFVSMHGEPGGRDVALRDARTRKRFYKGNVRSEIRTHPYPRWRQMWRCCLLSYNRGEGSIDRLPSPGWSLKHQNVKYVPLWADWKYKDRLYINMQTSRFLHLRPKR